MTNGEIFKRAADYLRERGWIAGQGWDWLRPGPLCLEGAVMAACGVTPDQRGGILSTPDFHPVVHAIQKRVGFRALWVWNDNGWRTAEEVIALLDGLAFDEDLKAATQAPAKPALQPVEIPEPVKETVGV